MNDINNDGYLLLKNILTSDQLQNGLNCDNDGAVNYKNMRYFIDNDFIPTISSNTNFMPNPKYVKFRYSNNNNSTDASTFHSDIYNNTSSEIMPIYTCLCYFDKTQMEVIPGSHRKQFHKENTSVGSYFQKKTIDIEPGDILVFHANLYHRGTNFNTKGDRRLLQVFEVFPDEKTYQQNYDKFLTVITANTATLNLLTNFSYVISKMPIVIDSFCFIHYILVYNDLQYKIALSDLAPWDKTNKLITYEPTKRINFESVKEKEPVNINIICENVNTRGTSNFYLFFYIIYWIVSFILIYYVGKWLNSKGYLKQIFNNSSKNLRRRR